MATKKITLYYNMKRFRGFFYERSVLSPIASSGGVRKTPQKSVFKLTELEMSTKFGSPTLTRRQRSNVGRLWKFSRTILKPSFSVLFSWGD